MCYFVAVGFPPAKVEAVQEMIGYELRPAPQLQDAFRDRQSAFVVNTGVCACDRFKEPIEIEDIERMRRHGHKRGWSATKIERVIAEQQRLGGLESELTRRIVNAVRKFGDLSLLVIWDEGSKTQYRGSNRVPADELVSRLWLIRAGVRVDIET